MELAWNTQKNKLTDELEKDKKQYKDLIDQEIKYKYNQKIEDKEKEINKINEKYSGQLKNCFRVQLILM